MGYTKTLVGTAEKSLAAFVTKSVDDLKKANNLK